MPVPKLGFVQQKAYGTFRSSTKSQLTIKSAAVLFSAAVEDIVTLLSLFRAHVAARLLAGFLDAMCSRQSNDSVDNTPSNFVKYVCKLGAYRSADQQLRLGEHVVHGGDALTE